jgi:hypothetical protein
VRGRKKGGTLLYSLRPSGEQDETSITSDPAELKSILIDSYSKLGTEDPLSFAFNRVFNEMIVADLNTIDADEKGTDNCEALFTAESIAKCIELLKNNKAPRIDLICNESMKYGGPQLVHSQTACLNSCWLSENTPSIWAKASVHLIYKGNDSDLIFAPELYRPISLTSNVSEVFERALFNRMQPKTDNVLPECTMQVFAKADHAWIMSTL